MRPAVAAAAVLLAATAAAAAGPTREQALAGLGRTDVQARRDGAAALADVGTMADTGALVGALRDPDTAVRALAERGLWRIWTRAGDPEIDGLMALGIEQMNTRQGEAAVDTFTRIIEKRPDFAEGWNKRATVYYLLDQYERSLADCDEVIKRNPQHFGALSGYGMIYLELGQPAKALAYFERALAVNPNLESVEAAVQSLKRLLIERRKGTI
ncbi:MAG: tetratricopeptide repeat protein [Candidatus Rokubacteria bacterium]|nr:tetratricopeptide repeat protein [Candidatus Rokubacteria bacterium]MBI3826212.1 tetratricopeptide repeat protein [Candidatus Rokubacteria bacterium]